MAADGNIALVAGRTPLEGGFRAVTRFPDPGKLSRARVLVLELGIPIPLESWESLASICDTAWLAGAQRVSPGIARIMRRRLRVLGSQPFTYSAAAAALGGGTPDPPARHLPAPAGEPHGGACVWQRQAVYDDEGRRWVVEEGHDFMLATGDGGVAQVLASAGHLVSPDQLVGGEEVSVFGFVDETPDHAGISRSPNGRGGTVLSMRSGSELPLLVVR